ncbi:MAG: helix-turn-helix domain-containing protein [Bacteroidales bacterium]|nr:helix-turn-helix domain-containing protein [Bacteroidales bacterium]
MKLSADNFFCKKIGIEDGLSQSSVTCLVYDRSGSLWIGTRFGLNQYKNGRLRTFSEDNSMRIRGSYTNSLFCDSRGDLWTSTDKGLFRYDLSSDSFEQISSRLVLCATQRGDSLYFGGVGGITVYNLSEERIEAELNKGATAEVVDIFNYRDGLLEVDANGEVYFIRGDDTEQLSIPEIAGKNVKVAAIDGNILYLSVMKLGLVVYDLSGSGATEVFLSGKGGMPTEFILSMIIVDHEVWLGTDGDGIKIFSPSDNSFADVASLGYFRTAGEAPLSITSLYKDPMGNIWVGSVRNGAFGLKPTSIKTIPLLRDGSESVVISLFHSTDGKVYVGTDGNGVFRLEPESGKVSAYPGQAKEKIVSIGDFDDTRIILFSYGKGFFLMDRHSGEMTPFLLVDETTTTNECLQSNVPGIYNLEDGRILITALNTYIYDKRTGGFEKCVKKTFGRYDDLKVLGSAGNGRIYAYSIYSIAVIDLRSKKTDWIFRTNPQTGIINTAQLCNGNILFGTNYGLYKFNTSDFSCEKQGYNMFKRVSHIHYAVGGNLWVAADNTVFLCRKGMVEMVGENRGMQKNEILADSYLPNGSLLLGGTAGLVEIENNFPYDNTENKTVELHSVSVNGGKIDTPSGKITLRHNQTMLEVGVNLAGADPFENVMYRFTVSGRGGFTEETSSDGIALSALQSGRHSVEVSYLMSDCSWSTPSNILEIRVLRPWYISTVSMAVYFIVLVLLIVLVSSVISRRQVRRMEAEMGAADRTFRENILNYIDAHLSEPTLNVEVISVQMAMSRATLYNKVKSSFGKGVADLIEDRRMSKAEELLKTTSLSMLEISEAVGFSTSGYFSTRFKMKHSGMTPLRYRQTNR